jgi:hypothetical protein
VYSLCRILKDCSENSLNGFYHDFTLAQISENHIRMMDLAKPNFGSITEFGIRHKIIRLTYIIGGKIEVDSGCMTFPIANPETGEMNRV